jgi:hypothetical protein
MQKTLDAKSTRESKATGGFLLRPDPYPLDSLFHGNDVGGYVTLGLTLPHAGRVIS